jgi:hypothetical protein
MSFAKEFATNTIFAVILTFIIFLVSNPVVTYDGWQYISSGKSIVEGSMASNYFFVRKPGYPLIVSISHSLGWGLWGVVALQVFLFITAFRYLKNILLVQGLIKGHSKVLFRVSGTLSFLLLGGYLTYVLQQSLFSAFLLSVSGLGLKLYAKLVENPEKFIMFPQFMFSTITGFFLSETLVIIPMIEYFAILLILKAINSQEIKVIAKKIFFLVSTFIVPIIVSSVFWNNLSSELRKSPDYNIENVQDPFYGSSPSLTIFKRLGDLPPYPQVVIGSFFANLDLIKVQGWDGIVSAKPLNDEQQNFFLGAAPFLNSKQPKCSQYTSGSMLTVNKNFITEYATACFEPRFNRLLPPFQIYSVYYLLWIALVFFWLVSLFKRNNVTFYLLSLPALSLVIIYSFLGGGIGRYGAPAYPLIILCAIYRLNDEETFSKLLLKFRKNSSSLNPTIIA